MSSDLSHFSSVFPALLESIFMSSSLVVILVDWNHSFLETSLLRLIQSYLPQWRKRNIRQDVYICLVITALALMYSNSMKSFAINTENCRIAGAAIVVLLSFWLQSKTNEGSVSDKCVGTSKVPVSDKSVGGSSVNHKDQSTTASTCCRARVPQFILSLSPTSGPQSEVNIEEELRRTYVEDFRKQVNEEEITQDELITAINYLNTLKGGIEANRSCDKLIDSVDHIQRMGQMSRLDDSGLPLDFSYEELCHIIVEEKGYLLEDFERVVEKWLKNNSFLPSPEEFAEIHRDMKGIVQLEREMEEKDREMEEKDREMEETRQEMEETLERTMRVVEETTQEVRESKQKNESLRQRLQQREQALQQNQQALQQRDQALQQRDQALQQERQQSQQALQQKDRLLDQERQRVRMLEERSHQVPEGEWQRRLRELEEEIRRLSAQSDRSKCKICRVEEVQVSFSPCNHLISCKGCVDSLPQKKCPLCRQQIQGTVNVLLA
ncbi:golgin subfamily A member 6-like protein 4 isoform X3 [Saccostrea echinata]|uniref:golgin subfamily A member 6-like protein 4 isoform X3 n=1 Tax=Saccostrea echinata TaxID=191078 RepID=UPI002A83C5F0|nr:golgin subfamily A member 6-like protein 4 isoform X3 [Saccostrea echinata]